MDLALKGKRVLVTAASQGLGYAIANGYAAEGAQVVVCSRDLEKTSRAVAQIQSATGNQQVFGYACDVSRPTDIEALFDRVEAEHGTVEILVNNAGGPVSGRFESLAESDWMNAYELTLMSVVRATRRALPGMKQHRFGRILNVVSTSVKQPIEDLILSNTFRSGVVALAKSLATEYGSSGIYVNNVGPGRIETDRIRYIDDARMEREGITREEITREWSSKIPAGRYGRPEEFAGLAVFLGSPANTYITGQTVMVDGGLVKGL